jgi:hypothetical protein
MFPNQFLLPSPALQGATTSVPTVLFQRLHVFFVIRLANREILHVEVTLYPTAGWAAQQIVELRPIRRSATRCVAMVYPERLRASVGRARRNSFEFI